MKAYESEVNTQSLNYLAQDINQWARAKGFWDSKLPSAWAETAQSAYDEFVQLKKSQKIMLIVTELAELVEGIRKPVEASIPGFTNEEEEVADAIIRLLDYAGHYRLRLGEAVAAKMAKNEGRPFMHGKKF